MKISSSTSFNLNRKVLIHAITCFEVFVGKRRERGRKGRERKRKIKKRGGLRSFLFFSFLVCCFGGMMMQDQKKEKHKEYHCYGDYDDNLI
mmetsp:Transcript_1952/g.3009  ORF Transcript_1952/g.3009 Transcript_1952/m.3009 type:complete len:91 (-) Transcript_1952:280-552(-)